MDLNFSVSLKLDKVKLKNVDCNASLKDVIPKLSKACKKNVENFNFIHQGQILSENASLKEIGLSQGSMIYCIPKNNVSLPIVSPLSLIEVQQLLVSLRAAVTSSNFRLFIHKLRTPEQITRLISECPALCDDPASLAFVQDADLISSLQNAECLSKIVEDRPVLGRVLQIVCNFITSDITSPRRSHHVSYSIDALSDDEMEVDQNDDIRNLRGGGSSQLITPAQLAAALANATGGSSWGGGLTSSAPRSGLTTPASVATPFNTPAPTSGSGAPGGASPGGPIITTEMFSQALQNAIAASATRSSGSFLLPPQGASQGSSLNHPVENIEESLQLMREMGIPDGELSLQALQATNGDVEAAVNLIFSQWMADD